MRISPLLLAALAAALAAPAVLAAPGTDERGQARPGQPASELVFPPWIEQQQGQYVYKPQYKPAPAAGAVRCNSATVATVLGGLLGGLLGRQVGQGEGRALAAIGGAVAGGLVDGEFGRRMDAQNQACVGEVLEVAPTGRRVQWVQGRVTYAAVPGEAAYRQGAYCRPYTVEMRAPGGSWQRSRGTACRRPDGVWMAG